MRRWFEKVCVYLGFDGLDEIISTAIVNSVAELEDFLVNFYFNFHTIEKFLDSVAELTTTVVFTWVTCEIWSIVLLKEKENSPVRSFIRFQIALNPTLGKNRNANE